MFRNVARLQPFLFSSFSYTRQHKLVYNRFFFISPRAVYSNFAFHPPRIFSLGRLLLGTSGALMAFVSFKINQFVDWSKDSITDIASLTLNSFNEAVTFGDRVISWLPSGTWTPAAKSKSKTILQENSKSTSEVPLSSFSSTFDAPSSNSEFSPLIRHLLEIQEILRTHGLENRLSLPNIVVLGGQSAGKTSVLEALVGYSFLPKGGSAMVTRRPLHLRLVHDADTTQPYAIFGPSTDTTATSIGPLYDMGHVEAMLRALNSSVDEINGIDENPIYLSIHAANLPDLSLIDLPGFIQVSSRLQSPQLRERIQKLANRYANQPNVLLAVCPADVDLANSEALKTAREVDPEGLRTIGVLSKLDLISNDPEHALSTLSLDTSEYPLPLGYVGLWAIQNNGDKTIITAPSLPQGGVPLLRTKLVGALEKAMVNRIQELHIGVCEELSEVELSMRVQFDDDRRISPDAYLSRVLATTSEKIESLASSSLSRKALEHALLEYMRSGTASSSLDGSVAERVHTKHSSNSNSLSAEISTLTRSHIGRSAANVIKSIMMNRVETLSQEDEIFKLHPSLTMAAKSACESILTSKLPFIILSVEASVKPFRKGTDFILEEWLSARTSLLEKLKETLTKTDSRILSLSTEVGGIRRLRAAIASLNSTLPSKSSNILQSSYLVECANEATSLFSQKEALERRISFLETSSGCNYFSNNGNSSWFGSGYWSTPASFIQSSQLEDLKSKSVSSCPDVYLNLLAERLASTAALYLHHEITHSLLGAFSEQFTAAVIKASNEKSTDGKYFKYPTSDNGNLFKGINLAISSSLVPGTHAFSSAALFFAHENPDLSEKLKMQSRRDALADVRDRLSYFLLSQSQSLR